MSGDGILADEPADARIVPALVFMVQTCRWAKRFAGKCVIDDLGSLRSLREG